MNNYADRFVKVNKLVESLHKYSRVDDKEIRELVSVSKQLDAIANNLHLMDLSTVTFPKGYEYLAKDKSDVREELLVAREKLAEKLQSKTIHYNFEQTIKDPDYKSPEHLHVENEIGEIQKVKQKRPVEQVAQPKIAATPQNDSKPSKDSHNTWVDSAPPRPSIPVKPVLVNNPSPLPPPPSAEVVARLAQAKVNPVLPPPIAAAQTAAVAKSTTKENVQPNPVSTPFTKASVKTDRWANTGSNETEKESTHRLRAKALTEKELPKVEKVTLAAQRNKGPSPGG